MNEGELALHRFTFKLEAEALKPRRTEAYLGYVGVRQSAGNEGIRVKTNLRYAFMPPSAM